ncbi:MAG: PcfB family protein, partial [Bacilli bacterium]|nr:PcfB family protein [Bacilli bacterium]
FTEEAKRYGVLYTALINKKAKDGVTDILVKAEDASKINRIVQRFNLARFDEVAIRGEIQKTKEMKSKGVKQKPIEDKIKEELHKNPIKKEEQSVNPHLAKTEKSPQSKPFLKEQKNSDKGSKIKERPSVREKLEKYKTEVKLRDQSEVKSEIKNKTPKDKTR